MAGEQLLNMINSRGGKQSDYTDLVYGRVISAEPLKIQLSNQIILTESFLVLSKYVTKYKLKGKLTVKSHTDTIDKITGNRPTLTEDVEFEVDETLKVGDWVSMIRADGGQQFYVFEREPQND
ncbi:hypothetical protein DS831_06070 [Bombilactobacillus bombi]|uniref:DUF2577 domain-containing protein n=1 Tax=Bombilactobacillus bombi TaxID=1303590 RepID=A0A3R6VIT5_9LACO|nr:DUF2577 domain-containing protein [Bombilactobacillus bombi]RHW49726.1 hypothetical protein DS831_06070 [Bombilactobacillus bombi]